MDFAFYEAFSELVARVELLEQALLADDEDDQDDDDETAS